MLCIRRPQLLLVSRLPVRSRSISTLPLSPLLHVSVPHRRASACLPQPQLRGIRRRITKKLDQLPQGPLVGLPPLPEEDESPGDTGYPTVIQQARNNMRKFSQCVVLTRVGGFYEFYFENAEEMGPLLGLKVAWKDTKGGRVAMVCDHYREERTSANGMI
jgi:MutS domain I